MLAYDLRDSTKDVDASMEPQTEIRKFAAVVGEEQDLPDGWLNDAFKGFAPIKQTFTKDGMPQFERLEVFRPTAEMLFAMKAAATRIEEGQNYEDSTDVKDLFALAKILELTSVDRVREIVLSYYPPDGKIQIPSRFWYVMEPIYTDKDWTMLQRRPYPSLRHVASALLSGHRFSDVLRTFLTYVDAENIEASIDQEPPLPHRSCVPEPSRKFP